MLLNNNLRRNVSGNKKYLPEIDGLRFFAISSVLLYHLISFYSIKNGVEFSEFYFGIFNNGAQGVQLFFMISGFILALPYVDDSKNNKKFSLKQYYLRRITRIEPPYIVSLLFFFLILVLSGKREFLDLLNHLFASLFYVHNIVYGKGSDINNVAWSLEVEIQFYLIVPFLVKVFNFKKSFRRIIFIIVVCFFIFINFKFNIYYRTLFAQFHFFLVGMFLADLYRTKDIISMKSCIYGFVGLLIFLFVNRENGVSNEILFTTGCFILFYASLSNLFWKKLLSNKYISIIGGMCYSIYLLHYPLISFFGQLFNKYLAPNNKLLFMPFTLILISIILFISTVFYILIEKPCMNSEWPKLFLIKIKSLK